MRINSSPGFSGNLPQVNPGELANTLPAVKNLKNSDTGIQFGSAVSRASDFANDAGQVISDSSSSLASLYEAAFASNDVEAPDEPEPEPEASSVSPTSATVPVESTQASDASDAANAPKASDAAFLDDSRYSGADALQRWAPMVAHLPDGEREQAAKELNRPIAAAWMAREKGENSAKAMEFINANPALKTAVDTAQGGGNADGKITNKDLKTFAKSMEKAADNADKDLDKYQHDNPGADPQSLEMVRNAALMRANMPLARAADPHNAVGATDKTDVDDNVGAEDLKNLAANNPGLSGALKQSCSTWSQPGFLNQLDEAGMKGRAKAAHSPDLLFNAKNMSEWIRKSAPTNGGQFAGMLSDAATINAVAGIDITHLDASVFDPEKSKSYSGAQKAAVMIKLQQTQQSVIAGRALRNTEKTEKELAERISQLQEDPDVQTYLNKSVPEQERKLVRSDAALNKAITDQAKSVNSGQALENDLTTADNAVNKHNPNPDYSTAIHNLSAQLQLQKDLFGGKVPDPQEVVSKNPKLESKIQDSYLNNFAGGGALNQLLRQKKVDGEQAMQMLAGQKDAYDSVLSGDFTKGLDEDYANSTVSELQNSKKGRKLLEGKTDESQKASVVKDLLAGHGPKFLKSIMGFASVKDMLKQGDKLGAAQVIYDSAKYGAEAIKGGVDAGARMLGREASVGLGRMAGQMVGRAVGMVAGEAAGMAAGMAVGASIPVIGWAIDGAMALGFGISMLVDAIKKKHAQKAFDHNVDPVLNQFGISKAH